MVWILIVVFRYEHIITSQTIEFKSELECKNASVIVKDNLSSRDPRTVCIGKTK